MNPSTILKLGKLAAFISFAIGTLIFLLFYFTESSTIAIIGLVYGAMALIGNFITSGYSMFKSDRTRQNAIAYLKTCAIMVTNIPIFIFYCWIGIQLLSTVRISFVNGTIQDLKDISIQGCENKTITSLPVGQSSLVNIKKANNCGISISYELNGTKQQEIVTIDSLHANGYLLSFKIGTRQKPYIQK